MFIRPRCRPRLGTVPGWFVRPPRRPRDRSRLPVMIEGKQVGDIVFAPDMSADIYEKWIGFLAIACSGIALMLLTGAIAHFAARSALRPLQNLGDGLTRMRTGDYEQPIPASGPPEIRKSAQEANELARTLNRLSQDNRSLLRQIVSLQDDERQRYGARASRRTRAAAVRHPRQHGGAAGSHPAWPGGARAAPPRAFCSRSRRCSRRTAASSTGCGRSTSRNWAWSGASRRCCRTRRRRRRTSKLTSQIDPTLNAVDGLLSQTIYRVIQEAVTNVLRHARADAMHVGPRSRTAK